jgi:FkbM family methyltransferase
MEIYLDLKKRVADRLAERIIERDYLSSKVITDDRSLDKILSDTRSLQKILADDKALKEILADGQILKRIITDKVSLDAILSDVQSLKKILANERAIKAILADDQILKKILTDEVSLNAILSDVQSLKKILANDKALKEILADDQLLKKILTDEVSLSAILSDAQSLNKILANEKAIKEILADGQILKRIITDEVSLNAILSDTRSLQKILADDKALKAILADAQLLKKILTDKVSLDAILSDVQSLKKILANERAIKAILADETLLNKLTAQPLLVQKTLSNDLFRSNLFKNRESLESLILDSRFVQQKSAYERLALAFEIQNTWERLRPHLQADIAKEKQKFNIARSNITHKNDIRDAILDVICSGDKILLKNCKMKFPDRHSLWIVIQEILINEEYYFETDTDSPRILDCGAHFGLAIYYFKSNYPKARITGFEPVPALNSLARENVLSSGYANVEILPYALSDKQGTSTFKISRSDSMAGSLTSRRRLMGDDIIEIKVECSPLSTYLHEPVHFLKLDIEGKEDTVLEEAAPQLVNVQHIFCEYHHGGGLPTNRLTKILHLLEEAGFITYVTNSLNFKLYTHRSMMFIDKPYSATIWAKNTNWQE